MEEVGLSKRFTQAYMLAACDWLLISQKNIDTFELGHRSDRKHPAFIYSFFYNAKPVKILSLGPLTSHNFLQVPTKELLMAADSGRPGTSHVPSHFFPPPSFALHFSTIGTPAAARSGEIFCQA